MKSLGSVLVPLALVALLGPPVTAQFQTGDIYVGSSSFANKIYRVDPVTWTFQDFADASDGLSTPNGLVFSPAGTLLCANFGTNQILEFDSAGNATVLYDATDGLNGPFQYSGMLFDDAGDLYVCNWNSQNILRFPAGGGASVVIADAADGLVNPAGLALLPSGDILIANVGGNAVLRLDPTGNVSVFDPGGTDQPYSIVAAPNGDVYVVWSSSGVTMYPSADPSRKAHLPGISSFASIAWDVDGRRMILTSVTLDMMQVVDTLDRTATTVIPFNRFPEPVSIAVFGDRCGPVAETYGSGTAGAGGMVPTLSATGNPVLGGNLIVQIRDFVGGAPSLLMAAAGPDQIASLGGTALINFGSMTYPIALALPGAPGTPGAGDRDLTLSIGTDPVLACQQFYLQQFALDSAAPDGISMSNGLYVFLGR